MSPQFVDFDADGHLDIVAGIFDGSPHVARGDGAHWAQPQQILDRAGRRIVGNQFWNFDTKRWDETDRCDPQGGAPAKSHVTSAIAFDADHDGDFDLLLGDHANGHVYLRRNDGTNAKPAFATRNELLLAGGEPMHVPGTVATLRALDWNGDGRLDLLVGSMGDPYGDREGGGVFVHLDDGDGTAAHFAAAMTLIPPSPKGATAPIRPDAGLYVDAGDHDGDGDLDLIVGGYSLWRPPAPPLDDAQRARLAELRATEEQLTQRFVALNRDMARAQEGLDPDAARKKREELLQTPERVALNGQRAEVQQQIAALDPGTKRDSFVWLYENVGNRTERAGER